MTRGINCKAESGLFFLSLDRNNAKTVNKTRIRSACKSLDLCGQTAIKRSPVGFGVGFMRRNDHVDPVLEISHSRVRTGSTPSSLLRGAGRAAENLDIFRLSYLSSRENQPLGSHPGFCGAHAFWQNAFCMR